MNPTREEALMALALEQPAEKRAAFLGVICEGDAALRARLDALLAEHEELAGVLGNPSAPGDRRDQLPESPSQNLGPTQICPPPEEAIGTTLGRYKLRERVGEGGWGTVYVAEQTEPVRRRVALKVIKLGMDTREVIARFEAERQALAMMDHANIAKVLDAGATENGRPYFVMELVRGIRITDYCDQNNLSTKERLDLFINVCHAIQHAHQKGIIHRDIKPSNILVTLHDSAPVPKVIDFGIAKATEGRLTDLTVYTELHQFIGTPAYMSPEQAEMSGLDIDTRSDIYALGVLLYELLTGKTPFDAQELRALGIEAMRRIIREEEPVKPSTRLTQNLKSRASERESKIQNLKSKIPQDLDWIVMKCLEKDRTRRYETANGLAADLKRHLTHEPVVARPPSTAYRFQKAFRRNKLMFTAVTVVAIALVAGIGISTWQTVEARKAQRETERARKGEQQQRLEAQSAQKVAETEQQRADAQARKASKSEQQSRRFLYASDMNLAQQALKLNNLGRARLLLDRHRPQPGEEDLRGWEWRYLWQLTRSSALLTLTNRAVRGFSVSFSPDGTRLAVGWLGGRVDLWDVPGRRLIRTLTDREYRHPARVAFSPIRNLLAATSDPQVVALYDLDSGGESILWRAPDTGTWDVRDLAFSQDGSKLAIYAGSPPYNFVSPVSGIDAEVSVVNISSSQIERRHPTIGRRTYEDGAVQLSPDNRFLYLARSDASNNRYSIQCINLGTGQERWQTQRERDYGLTTLAVSPDGRVLASGSGYEDPTIRLWDAATGKLFKQLDGHTGWVGKLVFTRDGQRLISAASDQSIRFWDTGNWTEIQVLRGHADEVQAVAISEPARLVASAGKDGNLILWKKDAKSTADGYRRLPENLDEEQVRLLDSSRVLWLPAGGRPELVDLKRDSTAGSLPEIAPSTNVLGWFGSNIVCHWNGTTQILVHELRGEQFIQRGSVALASSRRPTGFAYDFTRQLLAWTEETSANSIYLASLAAPERRSELKSDVRGLHPFRFSEDGSYFAAKTKGGNFLRVWNVETGQIVASIRGPFHDATFAAGRRVLIVALVTGNDHELGFYDLVHPERAPRRVLCKEHHGSLAVSPDGGLVASSTMGGLARLLDPVKGELIDLLHGHLNGIQGLAFSPDGRRLISTSGGREAVKLWDLDTRQELLTLIGIGSSLTRARWSADGDVILAGAPWQAWQAPSWEEIAAAEAKDKTEVQRP